MVDRRVHRRRRPGVRRADRAARRRRAGRRATRARRRVRRRPAHPVGGRARRRRARRRHRPDVEPDQRRRRTRAAPTGSSGPAPTVCRSPTASFDAAVACLVFEHIDAVDEAIAEVARVLATRRPVLLLPQPSAAVRRRRAAGSTTTSLDPPEQYWRIGPYLPEAVTRRGGRAGRAHPLRAPPARPLRQRPRRQRPAASSGWSSRRRRRGSSRWRRSTARRRPCRGCCISGASRPALTSLVDVAEIVLITGHVGCRTLGRRRRARGPRLVRRRQPAVVARREDRRAGVDPRQRHRPSGPRVRPQLRRRARHRGRRCARPGTA